MNNGNERMERVERIIAAMADTQDAMRGDMRLLLTSQVLMSETLTLHIAEAAARHQEALEWHREATEWQRDATERDRETTDKLNALITLMDQHIRDHTEGRA